VKLLRIQTLDKRWYDRDEVLLHTAFQVLVDFIECENPDKTIDWNAEGVYQHVWKGIKSLYKWRKETRPARRCPLDDKKLAIPPLKFRKIPGSDLSEVVVLEKKKYSAYYRALKRYSQLEKSGTRKTSAIYIDSSKSEVICGRE